MAQFLVSIRKLKNRLSHYLRRTRKGDSAAIPFTFLYFATTTEDFVGYLTNNATGAAYPAVTAATFEKADLLIPSAQLLKKFGESTIPMAEQLYTFQRQIHNLRRTRDLLLPRLLSGQILIA